MLISKKAIRGKTKMKSNYEILSEEAKEKVDRLNELRFRYFENQRKSIVIGNEIPLDVDKLKILSSDLKKARSEISDLRDYLMNLTTLSKKLLNESEYTTLKFLIEFNL